MLVIVVYRATGYGQHLSREEANELSRPVDGALEAVQDWLRPFVDGAGTFSSASNILKVYRFYYSSCRCK